MVNLVPNVVREIWDIWNIRGLVLTSFALQVCLLLFAPLRKCTNKSIVNWFLWSTYLLADYVATFCVGLILHRRDSFSTNSADSYIYVFWAPFLLLHLGGPDTITAFALEDNELWLRHLLGLVFQVGATVYLFFLTIPENTLWIPTTLVFVAGMIKYIERTRSLFLASMNALRKSFKELDHRYSGDSAWDRCARDMVVFTEGSSTRIRVSCKAPLPTIDRNTLELLRHGFYNFNQFKWLFVEETLDFDIDRYLLRTSFLDITPENALIVTEAELNFMYEFFFTKASVLGNKVGCLLRLASFISTVAALLVFVTHKKHGFNKLEIQVTYILLLGALALDTLALLRLIFSDWTIINCSPPTLLPPYPSPPDPGMITKLANNLKATLSKVVLIPFLKFRKPKWSNCQKEPYKWFHSLSTSLLFCKWSGTIAGHDFIKYCLHKTEGKQGEQSRVIVKFLKQSVHQVIDYFGAEELVETWIYKENNPFLKELWEFIFTELKTKSVVAGEDKEVVDRICEATGEWVLEKGELDQEMKDGLKPYVNSDVGSISERIMIWHIATGLCYYAEVGQNYANRRYFSKLLSDYMLYLLVMEPNVISAAAWIEGSSGFMVAANNACRVFPSMENQNQERFAQSACEAMINAFSGSKNDFKIKGRSLLIHACNLATKLKEILPERGWETVARIWVEMLSYVALNTRPDVHVQQLSKGGQLISLVWLLMLHMGLGGHQFQRIRRLRTSNSEPTAEE